MIDKQKIKNWCQLRLIDNKWIFDLNWKKLNYSQCLDLLMRIGGQWQESENKEFFVYKSDYKMVTIENMESYILNKLKDDFISSLG